MVSRPVPLSLTQALDILTRARDALPEEAARLGEVSALLQSLTEENAYLSALLHEETPSARPAPAAPPVETGAPKTGPVKTVTGLLREAASPEAPLNELLNGINDALRPPLIAIRGRAELVRAGLLGQITPEQDLWLAAIEENTTRGFAVLDALREMMALRSGQVRFEKVNFISTDLLSEAWERLRDRARPYGHEITIQAPDVVPLAHGDFYQSLLALTDILDNAIRYTSPGGQIRLAVDNLGTHVLFSVTDTGIGLTPDDLSHVSRPFWRGTHHRLVRQHAGTGLRLYLVRQILAQQDGELIFSGEPDVGSTFSFALPAPE
jgi:signal transduction histidine kinase